MMNGATVADAQDAQHVGIERRGAAAIVTLARPKALNALSIGMRSRLKTAFSGFGRDPSLYAIVLKSDVAGIFSVGGDVREMTGLAAIDLKAARSGLADELALCWVAECLSKPTVSFIDGRVMGTGVGISHYNTHRVAGEGYRFSMPETQIGYFPDCGIARAFAGMPDGIGFYLGLTGLEIGAADAYALGLVTHCIGRAKFAEIERALADADPVDPLLDGHHEDPGRSPLLADADTIRAYFDAPSLLETVSRLRVGAARADPLAVSALPEIDRRSPIALAVTDRMIRQARALSISEALQQDCRLAFRFLELADFREGVRAYLVDRDNKPIWQPTRIEDVTSTMLDQLFQSLGADELHLPARSEMQAARV